MSDQHSVAKDFIYEHLFPTHSMYPSVSIYMTHKFQLPTVNRCRPSSDHRKTVCVLRYKIQHLLPTAVSVHKIVGDCGVPAEVSF